MRRIKNLLICTLSALRAVRVVRALVELSNRALATCQCLVVASGPDSTIRYGGPNSCGCPCRSLEHPSVPWWLPVSEPPSQNTLSKFHAEPPAPATPSPSRFKTWPSPPFPRALTVSTANSCASPRGVRRVALPSSAVINSSVSSAYGSAGPTWYPCDRDLFISVPTREWLLHPPRDAPEVLIFAIWQLPGAGLPYSPCLLHVSLSAASARLSPRACMLLQRS